MTLSTCLADLAKYLEDNRIGTRGQQTTGISIKISGIHDNVGDSIFITPYGGVENTSVISGERNPIQSDVQIFISIQDHETALSRANQVYELLRDVYNTTIGSTHFLRIQAVGPPIFIMRSNGGFYHYSVNFLTLFI